MHLFNLDEEDKKMNFEFEMKTTICSQKLINSGFLLKFNTLELIQHAYKFYSIEDIANNKFLNSYRLFSYINLYITEKQYFSIDGSLMYQFYFIDYPENEFVIQYERLFNSEFYNDLFKKNDIKNLKEKLREIKAIIEQFKIECLTNYFVLLNHYKLKYYHQKYFPLREENNILPHDSSNYYLMTREFYDYHNLNWDDLKSKFENSLIGTNGLLLDNLEKYYFVSTRHLHFKQKFEGLKDLNCCYSKDLNYIYLLPGFESLHEKFWNIPDGLLFKCFRTKCDMFMLDLSKFKENYKALFGINKNVDFYLVGHRNYVSYDLYDDDLYLYQIASDEKYDFFEKFKLYKPGEYVTISENQEKIKNNESDLPIYNNSYNHIITNLGYNRITNNSFNNIENPLFRKLNYNITKKSFEDASIYDESLELLEIKNDETLSNWLEESFKMDNRDYDIGDLDSYQDETDWSNYDDNLDMDQQSMDFWNQF